MNLRIMLAIAALGYSSLMAGPAAAESMTVIGRPYDSNHILPGERLIAGPDRDVALLKSGAIDTINVPVTLAQQIREETRNFGPLGVVSGAVRGGIKGAILAMRGGTRVLIGGLDILTAPMGGLD
jgi:hypothetical protein